MSRPTDFAISNSNDNVTDYFDRPPPYADEQPLDIEVAWVAWSLLAILAAMFIYESNACGKAVDGEPDVRTLLALGALSRDLVQAGQWFRAFTCIFLHADPLHLLLNGVALFLTSKLEFIIGRAWFLLVFMISGLGGSLLSLATSDSSQVSVGASGAVLGLLAAQIIIAYTRYEDDDPTQAVLLNRGWGGLNSHTCPIHRDAWLQNRSRRSYWRRGDRSHRCLRDLVGVGLALRAGGAYPGVVCWTGWRLLGVLGHMGAAAPSIAWLKLPNRLASRRARPITLALAMRGP